MNSSGHEEWLAAARVDYERALDGGDETAALRHAAGVLDRINRELGAPPHMEFWLDALDVHLARWAMAPPPPVEPLVFDAGLAVLARRPSHPALPLWHGRAMARIRAGDTRADHALRAARFSFEYALRGGNFRLAGEIVEHARPRCASATPAVRCDWLEAEALEAWLSADHGRARALARQALDGGGGYGAWEQAASAALSEGDLAEADRCLAGMARTLDARRAQDVAHSAFLGAARAQIGGDSELASAHIDACTAVDATSVALYFVTLWQLGRAHVAIARGQHRRAAADLTAVIGRAATFYWQFLHFSALVARTWLRVREERPASAAQDLQQALALARLHGYRNVDPWWDPGAIAEIARFAAGVEHDRDTLARLVARAPPS